MDRCTIRSCIDPQLPQLCQADGTEQSGCKNSPESIEPDVLRIEKQNRMCDNAREIIAKLTGE